MKKKIQFSLVYRDMWQSSGKFQPRKDQLERIAPVIIEMGCFARVETNGGAFEQVNLLAGENPNDAVRAFCKPFNEAGIKTHMLDRGLNALRMYTVPDDVRAMMYRVKHAQGVDIPRIFDGLNDVRNIIPSIKWAKEAGMTPQGTLCITTSPITVIRARDFRWHPFSKSATTAPTSLIQPSSRFLGEKFTQMSSLFRVC